MARSTRHVYDARTLAHVRTVEISAAYPFPYGFVIGTTGADADAVDCFVLTEAPLPSGSTVECEVVGLLEQIEDGEIDHKVLVVLSGTDARVDPAAITAVKNFIARAFAHVPGKHIKLGRLLGPPAAEAYLTQCRDGASHAR